MANESDAKHWFIEWVVKDWLTAPDVTLCSESTRGIWFDALCNMFLLDRCGQVSGSYESLARLCRTSPDAMRVGCVELKSTGAADVTECRGIVTLTNRRMRRDYLSRVSARERKRKERGGSGDNGHRHDDVTNPPNPHPNPHPHIHSHPTQGGSGRVDEAAQGSGENRAGNMGEAFTREMQLAAIAGTESGIDDYAKTKLLLKSTGMFDSTIAKVMKFPGTTLVRVQAEIDDIQRSGGAKKLAAVLGKRLGYRKKS